MLKVTGIQKGIVIDHISKGNGIKIFEKLNLAKVNYPVVLLINVSSQKLGQKDIIKIQDNVDIDFTMLGLIDPKATVNIIEDEKIVSKQSLEIPKEVTGLFQCKNPRCVTSVDDYAVPKFTRVENGKIQYRCHYCEELTEYKL